MKLSQPHRRLLLSRKRSSSRMISKSMPRTKAGRARVDKPIVRSVGARADATIFAYANPDRTGVVADLIRQAGKCNTTIESVRCVVHAGRFYGTALISGMREHVEANVAEAMSDPMFNGPIARIDMTDCDRPRLGAVRKRYAVIVGEQASVQAMVDLAAQADLSISFCEMTRVNAPEGGTLVSLELNFDIHRLSIRTWDNWVSGIAARVKDGQIDMITSPLHD